MKAGCCSITGVITTCNGFRYAMGAAILDKDHPEKVLYRTREYLLGPAAPYELQGDVPMSYSPVLLCKMVNVLLFIMVRQILW